MVVGNRRNYILNDLENKEVYKMLCEGKILGCFQLETSEGMAELIKNIQPKCFHDINMIIALYRTAIIQAGMLDAYVRRRNGEDFEYLHESVKPVLENTLGVMVFQEQVMEIGVVVGGLSRSESDNFRKAMKLKDLEKFRSWQERFVNGAIKKGINKEVAEEIWGYCVKFSGYGFNKCLALDNLVEKENGEFIVLGNVNVGDKIKSFNSNKKEFIFDEVEEIIEQNEQEIYEILFDNGNKIKCTLNHKFLCSDRIMRPLYEIIEKDLEIICE